jgi:signal transduction histidine kinase
MCRRPSDRHDGRVTQTTPARPAEPRLPGWAGWAAAGVAAAFVVVGLVVRLGAGGGAAPAGAAAAVSLAAAALLARGRAVLLLSLVAGAGVVVLGSGAASNVGWFAVCVLAGWCSLAAPRIHSLLFWAVALAVFGAQALWAERDAGWVPWAVGTTCMTFAVLLLRHELSLVAELRAAQAGLADRARAEERTRIARELHDVIAHSLTVTLLHIAGARMTVRFDPADADRALAEAERLGRESLDEVRATVGLLKTPAGADDAAAPLPGLPAVPDLVDRFRAAGAPVALTVDGDPSAVPATTGLAVYRIVQEALTNAAKHAPDADVEVRIELGTGSAVDVAVDSAGRPGTGHGLGLDGMRERAASLGGTLTAGPGGRGWLVHARLPLVARRERSAR